MKRFISYFAFAIVILTIGSSCSSSKTSTETSPKSVAGEHRYLELLPEQFIGDFVGEYVWFEGKRSLMIEQHMMKSGIDGTPPHIYIDYHNGQQIVAYYNDTIKKFEENNRLYKFYGRVGSISGAGKGGGTHTEYYLDLIRIE